LKKIIANALSYDQYSRTTSISVLKDIFAGGPVLAGTRMSPFWSLLELRMMEVVVTTGATRRAKLQPQCHHQQTNTQIFRDFLFIPEPEQAKPFIAGRDD